MEKGYSRGAKGLERPRKFRIDPTEVIQTRDLEE